MSAGASAGASRESGAGSATTGRRDLVAVAIGGLALVLALDRFLRLSRWSLWFDETATWTDIHLAQQGGEIGHPLGYRLVALAVQLLGGVPDEFALRFAPAVAGWLAVALTWWTFRPLAGSRRSAAAALLVAASSWHVYWSQNARFYTMAQAVGLLGAALVLRGLWRRSVLLSALGFGIVAAGAAFHPSAGLLLPALVLAPILVRLVPGLRRQPDVRVSIGLLALLAVLLAVRFGWALRTFETYVTQKPQSSPVHFLLTTGFYVTPLVGTAALGGAVLAVLRRDAFLAFASVVVALVVLEALIVSLFARISAQYVFVVLPWITLLACAPVDAPGPPGAEAAEPSTLSRLRIAWLAVLLLPGLATTALYFTVRAGERPAWREAYEFVWNQREEGDLILGMEASVGEYYLNPRATELRHTTRVAWLDRFRAQEPDVWAAHARRTWYILNPEQLYDWKPEDAARMRRFLAEECRLVRCWPLYVESRDLSVWVYVRG